MKKIAALLSMILLSLALCAVCTCAEGSETYSVHIFEDFDACRGKAAFGYADPESLHDRLPFFYENGQLVAKKGDAASGCSFYLDLDCHIGLTGKGVKGIGFYMENNTSYDQAVNVFLVGQACYIWGGSTQIRTVSAETGAVELRKPEDGFLWVEAGFKGYILCNRAALLDVWTGEYYKNKEVAKPGFHCDYLEVGEGESLVFDNYFVWGEGLEDNTNGRISVDLFRDPEEPADSQTPSPSASASPSEQPQSSASAEPTPAQNGSGALPYLIGGAALIIVAAAVIIILLRKKRVDKSV